MYKLYIIFYGRNSEGDKIVDNKLGYVRLNANLRQGIALYILVVILNFQKMKKTILNLIEKIEIYLKEHRCSLTVSDVVILCDCVVKLKQQFDADSIDTTAVLSIITELAKYLL